MPTVEVVTLSGTPIEYRVVPGGDQAVVVMHGGHMHAGIELGEQVFRDMGYTVIVPSRPGYGKTSAVDPDRHVFADRLAELVVHLGFRDLAAVVGISAGGPWAIALATRHPGLVHHVVLENAISDIAWPDRVTRIAGRIVFGPKVERLTWAATRFGFRVAPSLTLRAMMTPLTTRSSRQIVGEFGKGDREALSKLFCEMRSGHGFTIDLRTTIAPAELEVVTQACLVLASGHDGSVGLEHADSLIAHLRDATLSVNHTSSHLMWFGPHSEAVSLAIRDFLSAERRDPSRIAH